jgi:hypothetical protein
MCHDRSWFTSRDEKAKTAERKTAERKPDTKDERSKTVEALLRDSNERAQEVQAAAKVSAPAK